MEAVDNHLSNQRLEDLPSPMLQKDPCKRIWDDFLIDFQMQELEAGEKGLHNGP